MKEMKKLYSPFKDFSLLLKNAFDIILGMCVLAAVLPFFVLIALFIKLDSTGPVFFKQQRVGANGKVFYIYKFRTMIVNAVNVGAGLNIIDNDPRITKMGQYLRNWSLDELTQIINIVKGEMSFIGPRPTLEYQVENYTPHQRKRLNMKPGITGWAQINGRNNIPWEERIDLDIWYVDNWSIWLDMTILFKTPKVVFTKDDVYSSAGVSYDFNGSKVNKKGTKDNKNE